jgi:hypothetical protein
MKLSRRTTTAAALTVLALGGTVAATAPASAASATYNGACGTGYHVENWTDVKSSPTAVIGTVYVAYNRDTDLHCAVLVRTKPGTRMFMEVTLDTAPTSGAPVKDYGSYSTYAGPVYLDVSQSDAQCMQWSGSIDIYYNSAQGLCS